MAVTAFWSPTHGASCRARSARTLAAVLIAADLTCQVRAAAPDQWFLVARHGGCFPIRSLERRLPDMPEIADPGSFIKFARAKGLKVTTKAIPVQTGSAVEVHVPEKELALVFATVEVCANLQGK